MKYLLHIILTILVVGCHKNVPLRGDLKIVRDRVFIEDSKQVTFEGKIGLTFTNDNDSGMVIDRFVKVELITYSSGKKIYSPFWPDADKAGIVKIKPNSTETTWIPFTGHLNKDKPLILLVECVINGKPVSIEMRERK